MKKILNITLKCLMVSILSTQLLACTNIQLKGEVPNTEDQEIKVDKIPETQLPKQSLVVEGATIKTRILTPIDFKRVTVADGSYAEYLRTLHLKPHGSPVLYYNGAEKNKSNIYMAVVDMEIGDRDLQQCADAIMRLRGEYLYGMGAYEKIHFNFTNGFRVDYSKWMEGYRIVVEGNRSFWVKRTEPSNTYQDFRRYMDIIFIYAGTISLENELISVDLNEMEIGDVFIQGGSPGHAVVVVDMAVNEPTGEKLFLLAQSYMPAQETQILVNPMDRDLSPWYSLNFEGEIIPTPEWTFKRSDLKRFP
ncbi:conserved hypothetical protein [Alkaliphilus metalliredigens QYMF]|uniref:Lipoprotein n=1 Tax=Alkaliphilus metalliredigens (strain QYMF) TaxID=293826 RepID=A6TUW9_ALKMQ|nr:DUF4846 domain-containing protein [Alkaliphilus metalliredigens]ABR49987.1 conserved hypothetical protein [Alkaliphilus metalliredigens QYMF]